MNVKQPADTVSPASGSRQPGAPALVVTAQSVQLCRRLGPLAWMALQYLAVSSHRADRDGRQRPGSATSPRASASPRTPPPAPSRAWLRPDW